MRDRQGTIVGAMELFADLGHRSLTAGRLHELEELALLDPLTRLSNRRHLDAELRARFEEQRRYGLACGVIHDAPLPDDDAGRRAGSSRRSGPGHSSGDPDR